MPDGEQFGRSMATSGAGCARTPTRARRKPRVAPPRNACWALRPNRHMTITKNGRLIRTRDEWRDLAGPKRRDQWAEGRSALEVARSWLSVRSPALPAEVAAALSGHECFGTILDWHAEPEVRLAFDHLGGEPRNTDLLVRAH